MPIQCPTQVSTAEPAGLDPQAHCGKTWGEFPLHTLNLRGFNTTGQRPTKDGEPLSKRRSGYKQMKLIKADLFDVSASFVMEELKQTTELPIPLQ